MYAELKRVWEEMTSPGQMFSVHRQEVFGNSILCYENAPASLRDLWMLSAGHGDSDYLVYQDERLTYAQSHKQTAALASELAAMGVGPGDRVAIAMRNYPEWMLAYWATVSMGAVVVGMNAWWVPGEMEYALEDSSPKVLIADRERLERFREIEEKFDALTVIAVRCDEQQRGDAADWASLVAGDGAMPDAAIDTDDDACIFYTSGTTGRPKGAQLTHRGCVSNVMNVAFINAAQASALAQAAGGEAPEPGSEAPVRALIATPLFHVTANNCVAQVATLVGGRLVLMYKWDAGVALKLIEQEQVSAFSAVPMMTREVLTHPNFSSHDTSSLKTMGGGGAAMQPDLVGKVPEQLPNTRPNTGYGMTETCGIIAALALEFYLDRPTSVGPVMPTLEARCVSESGEVLGTNEIGELTVKGAPVIRGYLNRPEATAETIKDGWLHTGDVGYIDEDGFVYLVDRAKDMVLRGGENVYCAEVENAVFEHDAVAECAAFSVPDERLGEEVGIAIYLKPGNTLTADELRTHCKSLLAPYKVPRYVWLVAEPLPRNANGKFVKRQLQDDLAMEDAA
ncbi:MAG: class I adenylate-forming enzyme family protein [Pseudomonadota bacterium]